MNGTSAVNIVFIQVDQLNTGSLQAYGDSVCHALNLDKLANTGTVF